MNTRVLDLVGQPVEGMRAQVRHQYDWPDWKPAWRTLKTIELRTIKGVEWVYVTWEPVAQNEMDFRDCGYGGMALSAATDWMLQLESETLTTRTVSVEEAELECYYCSQLAEFVVESDGDDLYACAEHLDHAEEVSA